MADMVSPKAVNLGVATQPVEPVQSGVVLSIGNIMRTLIAISAAILALHLLFQLTPVDFFGSEIIKDKLHIDEERSVPTYLAAFLLTSCGVLAWWLSRIQRLPRPGWALLAIVFAAAGIEEVAAFHEELSAPVRSALGVGGWLRFAWVFVGGAVALVIAAAFLRTFLALPARVRRGLALGAGLFLGGALGMELPGGQLKELVGTESTGYVLVSTLEEGLELAGVLVWLRTLLVHLRGVAQPPTVRIGA